MDKQFNYTLKKMSPNDLETVYNKLYCKNNAVIDENIGDYPILSADRHYSIEEFKELLEDNNTVAYISEERKHKSGYYFNDINGFFCYERKDALKTINLLFLEAVNNSETVYEYLIETIINKVNNIKDKSPNNYFNKITIELEDGQYDKMKIAARLKFKQGKVIRGNSNCPDTYIYEKYF